MGKNTKNTAGSIKVSENVIVKIAKTAALEIDGVSFIQAESDDAISKLKRSIPVRAKTFGETAAIKLEIFIDEGVNAVKAAENVQKSVKSAVQNMTGFTVTKVDVKIAGVSFKEEENGAEVKNG
ncbi:MAG: Asp23/Gls24 family envelope stress response protein [Oscillospiraceae bacterium]|nr:Asp23/Gls24 family envelope stress response protein [Oscillospiraceae bacterium]